MSTSRREFVYQSLAVAGAAMVCPGCTRGRADQSGSPPLMAATDFEPAYVALEREGVLADRAETLWAGLESCEGCARMCGANRLAGQTGVCSTTAKIKIIGAVPHHGEERELVGRGGSGTPATRPSGRAQSRT